MKKILLSLVAMMIATVSFAQNELVATRQHGDQIDMFYGTGAFASAVSSAENDDIIVLSEGQFSGSGIISKNIIVRGAGTYKTTIMGELTVLGGPKAKFECLTIERVGRSYIGGNYYNCLVGTFAFNKVCINIMNAFPDGSKDCAWFENCIIKEFQNPGRGSSGICYFVNCKLANLVNTCNIVMNNCTINQTNVEDLSKSRISNSIIWNNGSDEVEGKLPASTVISNTLAAGNYKEIFADVAPEQNCQVVGMDVFGESNPENDLTEEAKSAYLGTDGTPVGIFGGQLPFNTINPYPYISKMNVGAVTTADGKLSVEVEVSTAE